MWVPCKRLALFKLVCLTTFIILLILLTLDKISPRRGWMSRTFYIDFEHDTFLKDGQRFRFISGSFHYFRAPRSKWRGIMRAMRAAGLNAVSSYVEWSTHEVVPGVFRYDGFRDIEHFLQLAREEGLFVLLRPGPFIGGERDFGGLPAWIYGVAPRVVLRQNDPDYQRLVTRWFHELFSKIRKHLYGNGGPIILVQVENEYGSDENCDPNHAIWLRDLLQTYVQDKAVLYSTDGAFVEYLACTVDGVYPTVDFTAFQDTDASFQAQRSVAPKGPLVNSEFYTGWFTHWKDPFLEVVSSDEVVQSLDEMLEMGASVNLYMFYGGTNFGFTSGANLDETQSYRPCLTSYDYDSPLNEAGDPTEKYFAIRDVIGKYVTLPRIPLPEASPKGDYGNVVVKPKASLFDLTSKVNSVSAQNPLPFEQMSQNTGCVLYETTIPEVSCHPCLLNIPKFHDMLYVFIDKTPVSQIYRSKPKNLSLSVAANQKLSLLVENMGRGINQGGINDMKGILANVKLGKRVLYDWTMIQFPMNDKFVSKLDSYKANIEKSKSLPMFFMGNFLIATQPLDTFLDMNSWSKGVVFMNGHNLGRYWSDVGPQYSLFVPSEFLHLGLNNVTIFELKEAPRDRMVRFCTAPIFNYEAFPVKQKKKK